MKRASDGQLLAAVLAVPVGALLLISGVSALLGEPNTGETIAIGCAIVLMLSSLLPQLAGVRFATNGPRSLQNRLEFYCAFFAMMLVGQMPDADQSLARAALGWLPLALVIALVGFSDLLGDMSIPHHIKALRRHPRALRKVLLDFLFGVVLGLALVAAQALGKGASAPQVLWAGLVMCGAILAAPSLPFARSVQMPNLRLAILTLAYGICFAALMFLFGFVGNLGEMEGGDAIPLMIGGVVGSYIGMGIMVLIARNRGKRGKPTAPPSPME